MQDTYECECSECGWRGRVRFSSARRRCGGCGTNHMLSPSQWLDVLDGNQPILVLSDPDRRGKRGRDRGSRKTPIRR